MVAVTELGINLVANASDFNKTMAQASKQITKIGKDVSSAGATITKMTAPLAAIGVASVVSFTKFDKALNESFAIMGNLTDAMRNDLSNAAREVGKTTTFSAAEAAEAYFFLASAGLSATESIAAMPVVAQFAQAGSFSLKKATDLLTDAQTALGGSTENLVGLSDILVKGNLLANASVEQFSISLTRKAGTALKLFGKSAEEGVAALTVFADAGVKGEMAGTALGTVLTELPIVYSKNTETMDQLGIKIFDTEGKYRNLADIIGDLEKATNGYTVEEKSLLFQKLGFNKQLGASIGLLLGNSEKLRENQKALTGLKDVTKEIAEKQLQSFQNKLILLKDNFIDASWSIAEVFIPALTKIVDKAMDLIKSFSDLDTSTKQYIVILGTVVTATGPVLYIMGQLLISIGAIGKALTAAKTAIVLFTGSTGIGLIAIAIVAAVTSIVYFYDEIKENFTLAYKITKEIFTRIVNVIDSAFNVIATASGVNYQKFKTDFGAILTFIVGWGKGLYKLFVEVFKAIADAVIIYATSIKDIFAFVFEKIIYVIRKLVDAVEYLAPATGKALREFSNATKDLVKPLESVTKETGKLEIATDKERRAANRSRLERYKAKDAAIEYKDASKETTKAIEILTDATEDSNIETKKNTDFLKDSASETKKSTAAKREAKEAEKKLTEEKKEAQEATKRQIDLEIQHQGQLNETSRQVVDAYGQAFTRAYDEILGESAEFIHQLGNLLTNGTAGIGGAIGDIFNSIFGEGKTGSPLGNLIEGVKNGGNIFDGLFGGRPEGVEGPLMENGNFSEGLFGGENSPEAWMAAAEDILAGLAKIGQTTKDTFTGVGQIGGAALGAYLGGPIGAKIGAILGEKIGKGLGRGFVKSFGGSRNPATLARREFEKQLNNLIDGKNISIIDVDGALKPFEDFTVGAKDRWNNANWPQEFQEFAGSAANAFTGVGIALGTYLDVSEDIHGQIGVMLFDQIGTVENLGLVLTALEIPIESFEEKLMEALQNGTIGLREYVIALNGLRETYAQAEESQNDLDLAMQLFVATGGDSIQTLKAFRNILTAATKKGITSVNELVEHFRGTGKFTAEQLEALFTAFSSHGISSLEEVSSAGDDFLASIIVMLSTIAEQGGANFFELAKDGKKAFQEIEEESKKAGKQIEKNLSGIEVEAKVNVNQPTSNAPSVDVTPSMKGNIFSAGSITPFFKGGVVDKMSLFNIGSMAERGPEAIMPLERLSDGRLGVLSASSGNSGNESSVTINVDARHSELGFEKRVKKEIENVLNQYNRVSNNRWWQR